jgi:pentatricopeptide repeat protein
LCKKGEFQKAVQLVDEIVTDGCIPSKGTWKLLIGHTLDKTIVGEASDTLLRDLDI